MPHKILIPYLGPLIPIDSALSTPDDENDQEILDALPIRRKRADTELAVHKFAQLLADSLVDTGDDSGSSDQSGGDSPAQSPPPPGAPRSSIANTKRASRKIVRYGIVEVKDFAVQVPTDDLPNSTTKK